MPLDSEDNVNGTPTTDQDSKFKPLVETLASAEEPPSSVQLLGMARWLYNQHAYECAEALCNLASGESKSTVDFLKLRRSIATKKGSLGQSIQLSNELAEKKSASPQSLRLLSGRYKELTGWVPRLPGQVEPLIPKDDKTIVHLVKESAPYLSNGFCSRSQYNFLAEQSVGFNVKIMTEPGFPNAEQRSGPFRAENVHQGIGHYHFDLGTVDTSALPSDTMLELWAELAYRKIKIIRPAIIHASSGRRGYETALVAMALSEKTGIPFVYEVRSFFEANWTADIDRESSGEIYSKRRAVELLCMSRAAHVLTIGESMRREIISRGVSPEKVSVIPNGVDSQFFTPMGRSRRLAKKHDLVGKPTFGYISNMDHYRESQETLIECAKVLSDQGTPMECILVGDGPRRELLENLADELGVSDLVHFLGRVDHSEIPEYYSIIDYFVVPRIPERSATYVTPLKPFEAMASGCCMVISDLPALREIVDPPNRGLSFTPGNADDLAKILTKLNNNDELRARLADAGTAWVQRERTWMSNGPRYKAAFEKVLQEEV